MKTLLFTLLASLPLTLPAQAADRAKFFAIATFQQKAPKAFVLTMEGQETLPSIEKHTIAGRTALLSHIRANPGLLNKIISFPALTPETRTATLRELFALEVEALGIEAPELVIADDAIPGPAYFDFDLAKPGPGRVILNPKELAKLASPFESVLLLMHETRHSAQLQLAQRGGSDLAEAYLAAFKAQKELKGFSFCDFLTLQNEYEAFQFANYVFGALTNFQHDFPDMGTYASQFGKDGNLKIDLLKTLEYTFPYLLLPEFNNLSEAQFQELSREKPNTGRSIVCDSGEEISFEVNLKDIGEGTAKVSTKNIPLILKEEATLTRRRIFNLMGAQVETAYCAYDFLIDQSGDQPLLYRSARSCEGQTTPLACRIR